MNASTRGGRASPSIEALLDSVADSSTPVAVRRASCAPRVSSSDLGDGWACDTAGGRSARPDSRRNSSATLRPPPAAAAAVARRAPGSRGGAGAVPTRASNSVTDTAALVAAGRCAVAVSVTTSRPPGPSVPRSYIARCRAEAVASRRIARTVHAAQPSSTTRAAGKRTQRAVQPRSGSGWSDGGGQPELDALPDDFAFDHGDLSQGGESVDHGIDEVGGRRRSCGQRHHSDVGDPFAASRTDAA